MKNIELPRKVLVGQGAIRKVSEIVFWMPLKGISYVVCDENTRKIAGEDVANQLNSDIIESSDPDEIISKGGSANFLLAVGGGSIIDAVKIASKKLQVPFISIPTSASHDGIVSPQASIKKGKPVSMKTQSPIAVIADTTIIAKAPQRLLSSGCADAISNYTAVLDWKLAKEEKGEYYGDYAAALSELSANIIMDNADKALNDISMVVEALISSGVAIGIAGSSRPCSGSEHAFSHALDLICEQPALHGEQCGVGTIIMAYLHDADWMKVKDSLKKVNAPVDAAGLNIPEEDVIQALTTAHSMRDRYTILRKGLSEERAREVAEKTGVI
ncbi:MAG: NAD(P)-dependent glycerol-1-phosphate dehydrogenase [Methanobacteriota archaeon]